MPRAHARSRRARRVTPETLIECFDDVARAVRDAVSPIDAATRRARTEVPGQYALDVIADAAALEVLAKLPVRVVSEESGVHERSGATVTVVLDPVDGSTNFSRGIAYWAISLCALDADGALAALVVNQATGQRTTAIRGQGAQRDGVTLRASSVTKIENAVIALVGLSRARAAVEAVPGARLRVAHVVRRRGRRSRRASRFPPEPRPVGLSRRLPRVCRSRRDRSRRERRRARDRRLPRASPGDCRGHARARRRAHAGENGMTLDLDALLVAADKAARAGGEIVRAHFGSPPEVREKSPGDWVTAADIASEDVVRAVLERETGLPVFGEEAGGERADIGWLVDPLDGTVQLRARPRRGRRVGRPRRRTASPWSVSCTRRCSPARTRRARAAARSATSAGST